jgi:hypothetical protein
MKSDGNGGEAGADRDSVAAGNPTEYFCRAHVTAPSLRLL